MNKQEHADVQHAINLINYAIRSLTTLGPIQPSREKLLKAASVLGQLTLTPEQLAPGTTVHLLPGFKVTEV